MTPLASMGLLLCLLLFCAAVAYLPYAIRADFEDAHLLHKPGTCPECEES